MDNKFFTFIKPFLAYIDRGDFFRKPFCWLYSIFAAANIAFPLYLLYKLFSFIGSLSGGAILIFILCWLGIALCGWLGFQLWWDRKDKVKEVTKGNDDFLAIPSYSHFIQTLGEWFGIWVAISGFWLSLLQLLYGEDIVGFFGLPGGIGEGTIPSMLLAPVYGFLIVVGTRVFAELIRALASIANNTKK